MNNFFHGRRRKAGVVTLVMALAVMGLWIRSQHTRDSVQVRIADNAAYLFISNESELIWQGLRCDSTGNANLEGVQFPWFAVLQRTVSENRGYLYDRLQQGHTKEDYLSTVFFKPIRGSWKGSAPKLAAWKIPHWSLVLPLTLLSAYLILWKPRKRVCPN